MYQRTANWCTPLNNAPITPDEQAQLRADFEAMRETLNTSVAGFLHQPHDRATFDDSRDERLAFYEKMWNSPGFSKLSSHYTDLLFDPRRERGVVRVHRREDPQHRRAIPRPRRS